MSIEVASNSHFSANTFSATFASVFFDSPCNNAFWASETNIAIQVLFTLDGISFVNLFAGTVDTVALNATQGLVHIAGRDLSTRLIETRTEETFSNRTSSEIASLLANRHGLTPNVVQTTTPVGRYYQDEHDRITLGQYSRSTTEWDLLVFLALQEGFDVTVTGTVLNFRPSSNTTATPYIVAPTDCIEMTLERRLPLAQDITVTIKSWNSRQSTASIQTVTNSGAVSSNSGRSSTNKQYLFVRPNLTGDQALKFARQKLDDLTMHERVVDLTVPGDLSLAPPGQLIVTGTGTEFDQTYSIDLVESRLSLSEGFTQRIRAKGSSPQSLSSGQTAADATKA
jgi:phage protein D